MIKEGKKAPHFELSVEVGRVVRLKELKGRLVILYFYPKDDTRGCTLEALDFTRLIDGFKKNEADVIGVSPDSPASHDRFKAKHDLAVLLGSDEEKKVCEAYGVWVEKTMYGRTYMGVERSTFLIDQAGIVRRIWRKVKAKGHAEEVLEATTALASHGAEPEGAGA